MQRMSKTLLAIATLAATANLAVADDASKAKEIFEKSTAAIKQAKTISYQANYTSEGWLKQFVADVSGNAIIGPSADHDVPRFSCEVAIKKPDWEEAKKFTAGCDGDEYFLIDAETKTAYQDMDPTVLGSNSRDIQRANMRELTSDEPFKDLMEGTGYSVKETTVDGELCYEIKVDLEKRQEKAQIWWIAKKDHLPRGVRRVYPPRGEESTEDGFTQLMITNVVAKADFNPDAFKLKVPAGFTKTDEFAP